MPNLRNTLKNKNAKERANLKGQEIARLAQKKAHNRQGGLRIEIVDTNAIEGGVEVFARAWKNGKQIGFGKDGTVDIERFRIFNPPILVPDPQGDIVRVQEANPDLGTERSESRYREDPQEALIQVLEHNLTVMKNIHSAERIVKGNRGNTTSTFYPDADPESTSVDGWVEKLNTSTVWSTVRNASSGSHLSDSSVNSVGNRGFNPFVRDKTSGGGEVEIGRTYTLFDTSGLADDGTVDSAILSLYITGIGDGINDSSSFISIVTCTPVSNTALALGDYSQVGSIRQHDSGQDKDITGITMSAYLDWTLNATGIGNISKTGVSKFAQREGHDLDDVAPPNNDATSGISFSMADETGTTKDPKLVVEHSASATDNSTFFGCNF